MVKIYYETGANLELLQGKMIGVIAVAVWGIRQFSRDGRRDGIALDIAKERLARGEITSEEFARIRGDLA